MVLNESPVVGLATEALAISYTGQPLSAPTLTYQWKIGNTATSAFTDISGATDATYTPLEDDLDEYIKCEVTASETAIGTVLSNAKKVIASED